MSQETAALLEKKVRAPLASGLAQHTAVRSSAERALSPLSPAGASFAHDLSQVPAGNGAERTSACPLSPRTCPFGGACHTCPARVQAKLAINHPGDAYEQEADRVASVVMRMPEPDKDEEERCRQPGCAPGLQRRAVSPAEPTTVPPIVHEVLSSPGQPLDAATRAYMEPRFGHDFSGVRVHVDAKAAESAQAVNALAYTVGKDVVFGAGYSSQGTVEGQKLLAHELAHTLQQGEQMRTRALPRAEPETEELTRAIVAGEHPLKLAFYDSERYPVDFFRIQANAIAEAIEAVQLPPVCPKDRTKLRLSIGGIGFTNSEVLPHLRKAVVCTGRKVSEFHVVGHWAYGVEFSNAAKYAETVEPQVRVIFHGCSVLSGEKVGVTELLKAFGSEAEIFGHTVRAQASQPYEFRKVTLPEESEKIKTEFLKQVTVILPKSYILKWASVQKSDTLYELLKRKREDVQDDAKEVFMDVLKARLKKDAKKWSERTLGRYEKKPHLYDWEQEIILEEIGNRASLRESVQYWKTSMLEQALKDPSSSPSERRIILEELVPRRRLRRDARRWSVRKLELNLSNPLPWLQEIAAEELSERKVQEIRPKHGP